MNILFILGSYKPNMSANGICSDNVIQQLLLEGHSVTALVNAVHGAPNDCSDGKITIKRVKQRWYIRLMSKGDALSKEKPHYAVALKRFAFLVNKIQLLCTALLWPVVSPLTVFRFRRTALSLQKAQHYDVVISVYTPIEALLAGYAVKKKYPEIKFIPYYLDALAGGWGPSRWSASKKERHTRFFEKKVDVVADLIISMNSSREYHLRNQIDIRHAVNRCYLDVPTLLLPKEKIETKEASNGQYQFLYAGNINYPNRNPIPLLEIMSRLCNLMELTVIFAGSCNQPKIFQLYTKKTNGKIRYLGQQTHNDILSLARQADGFLNIGSTNQFTIASKIFEYMIFQKPIISTFSIDKEPSISYIKKYGQYFLIDERSKDYDSIARELQQYIVTTNAQSMKPKSLDVLFYNNTPQAFTTCVTDLVEGKQ